MQRTDGYFKDRFLFFFTIPCREFMRFKKRLSMVRLFRKTPGLLN
jgi:hypothetical protein